MYMYIYDKMVMNVDYICYMKVFKIVSCKFFFGREIDYQTNVIEIYGPDAFTTQS